MSRPCRASEPVTESEKLTDAAGTASRHRRPAPSAMLKTKSKRPVSRPRELRLGGRARFDTHSSSAFVIARNRFGRQYPRSVIGAPESTSGAACRGSHFIEPDTYPMSATTNLAHRALGRGRSKSLRQPPTAFGRPLRGTRGERHDYTKKKNPCESLGGVLRLVAPASRGGRSEDRSLTSTFSSLRRF